MLDFCVGIRSCGVGTLHFIEIRIGMAALT